MKRHRLPVLIGAAWLFFTGGQALPGGRLADSSLPPPARSSPALPGQENHHQGAPPSGSHRGGCGKGCNLLGNLMPKAS